MPIAEAEIAFPGGLRIPFRRGFLQTFDGELVGFPSDVFKQHCFVAPFPEEDVEALAALIGPTQVLFGSDWPHPEGVAQPEDFRKYVAAMGDHEQRLVMRDNALRAIGVL